jgi:hypothetical protein
MIRRVLAVVFFASFFAASALAGTDIDRHGTYTEKGASGAAAQKCKTFAGSDDNRTDCADWCTAYLTANAETTCACEEGACSDAILPQAAAAPAPAPAPAQ